MTSDRGSVFLYCPVFRAYPPQPVLSCSAYRPAPDPDGASSRGQG